MGSGMGVCWETRAEEQTMIYLKVFQILPLVHRIPETLHVGAIINHGLPEAVGRGMQAHILPRQRRRGQQGHRVPPSRPVPSTLNFFNEEDSEESGVPPCPAPELHSPRSPPRRLARRRNSILLGVLLGVLLGIFGAPSFRLEGWSGCHHTSRAPPSSRCC